MNLFDTAEKFSLHRKMVETCNHYINEFSLNIVNCTAILKFFDIENYKVNRITFDNWIL